MRGGVDAKASGIDVLATATVDVTRVEGLVIAELRDSLPGHER